MSVTFPAQVTANLVVMWRQLNLRKAALIVEGPKDSRFFKKVVDYDGCFVFTAGNRDLAEETVRILEQRGLPGMLGVVDADCDHIAGSSASGPNLLVTHTRDVEGIILSAAILPQLLIEFDLDGNALGPDPDSAVVAALAPLGYLRHVIDSNAWQVRLTQVDYMAFIDPTTLKCDEAALCSHMESLTITRGITGADYQAELFNLAGRGMHPLLVARGHDITSFLARLIKSRFGKKRKEGGPIDASLIESYLRMAYPVGAFEGCPLGQEIRAWEGRNVPYRVF